MTQVSFTFSAVGADRIHIDNACRTHDVAYDVLGAVTGCIDSHIPANVALRIRIAAVVLGDTWVPAPRRKIRTIIVGVAAWVVLQTVGAAGVDIGSVGVAAWVVFEAVGPTRMRRVTHAPRVVGESRVTTRMGPVRRTVMIASRVAGEPVVTADVERAKPVECAYWFEVDAACFA